MPSVLQATLSLLGVVLIGGCGHDVTAIDMMFLASGNPAQTETRLPWGPQHRVPVEEHAVHVFARLSEHYDDTTTFDVARIARLRAGHEALDVHISFEAWSGVDAEATELEHTMLGMQVRQDGDTHTCGTSAQVVWKCSVRYREFEAQVRYEVRESSGEVSTHEVTVRMSPAHLRHEVNNSVALIINGV